MGKHHNIWKDFVSFWGPLWKGNGGRVTWLKLWNIIKQMQIHQRRIFYGGHESRHTWADPRLWSCHYRCWYGPTKLRFHFPRLQHKQILRNVPELTSDSGAVATIFWKARGHNPIASVTPHSKRSPSCSYLWKNTVFDDVTMNEIQPAG